eukprot:g7790.t1
MPRKSKKRGLSCGKKKPGDKNAKRAKARAASAKLPAVKKVKQAVRSRPLPKYASADSTDAVSGTLMRALISAYFVTQMDAPPKAEWRGRDGAIGYIIKNLKGLTQGHYKTVERVLEDTVWCHKHGFEYRGEGRYAGVGGHNKLIAPGSFEEQLVADTMEDGLGLDAATEYVNDYRTKLGLVHVGKSDEVKRVKSLSGGCGYWTEGARKIPFALHKFPLLRLRDGGHGQLCHGARLHGAYWHGHGHGRHLLLLLLMLLILLLLLILLMLLLPLHEHGRHRSDQLRLLVGDT